MARHESAIKAARQALKHQERNIAARAKCRTAVKTLRTALSAKITDKEEAKKTLTPILNHVQKVLMKAANKNLIKRGTASRQIARLSIAVNKVLA